jgi:hypothetical protein
MVLLASSLLAACGDDGTDTAETGAGDGTSTAAPATDDGTSTAPATGDETAVAEEGTCFEPPHLRVVNQDTGNAVEEITMVACDMSDEFSYPVPPGGLPDGGEITIDLPGPGCWVLQYSGEGCFGDVPGMAEATCGETVEWVLTGENHVCAGI